MIEDAIIDQLVSYITVNSDDFDRTFLRSQAHRDECADIAVLANAMPDLAHIPSCFHFARKHNFLRELLRASIVDQVAGPVWSERGRAFAELCRAHAEIIIDIAAINTAMAGVLDADNSAAKAAPGYLPEARNPAGFDGDAHQMSSQLQSTVQMVCRIEDLDRQTTGTGVLIAPHLVATAAHVIEGQIDSHSGEALTAGSRRLRVRLDTVFGNPGGQSSVALDENWLAGLQCCGFARNEHGEVTLPSADEAADNHDVAVLRLAAAPGYQQGWMDVSEAGRAVDPQRRGLLLHHHPGGADQGLSHGSYKEPFGAMFKHSCTSAGGSSGGPLLNYQARLVGIHNGRVLGEQHTNLGGGGAWLERWWRTHPEDHQPDAQLNPIWEILTSGRVGTGDPAIGFDELQRQIWDAQIRDRPMAATVEISAAASTVFHEIIRKMLPLSQASVLRLTREELDKAAILASSDPNPVTAVLAAIADRIGPRLPPRPVALSAIDVATDAIRAQELAGELAGRLREVHTSGRFWLIVGVGNGKLTTAVSEALGHVYRAVVGMDGGKGRLIVSSAEPAIHAVVGDLLRDTFGGSIEQWRHETPDEAMIANYLRRWFRETRVDQTMLNGVLALKGLIRASGVELGNQYHGGDIYGGLMRVLREQLPKLTEAT